MIPVLNKVFDYIFQNEHWNDKPKYNKNDFCSWQKKIVTKKKNNKKKQEKSMKYETIFGSIMNIIIVVFYFWYRNKLKPRDVYTIYDNVMRI